MAAGIFNLDEEREERAPRIFRDRTNPLDCYSDKDIIRRYRLTRESIFSLIDKVGNSIQSPTNRSHAIPPSLQVMATLRFYATGSMQRLLGDSLGISSSSVCRSIGRVTDAICQSMSTSIKFPSGSDLTATKVNFFKLAGFPNVVGAIDGTLVPIQAPKEDEHLYVCRKGFHALNIQAIVDAEMRFTSVVSRWPGSTHDAFVWASSQIARRFENKEIDGWLIGDSGYPLRPWLLTPVSRVQARPEERYNSAHRRTRVIVEQSFGVLKSRFRCLHRSGGSLAYEPEKCCRIAFACFLLHNVCINNSIPLMLDENEVDEVEESSDDASYNGPLNDGKAVRGEIIRRRFSY